MSPVSVKSVALAATALFASLGSAVQPLKVTGSNFVTSSSGDKFSMIGVDYQPGGSAGFDGKSDPLSDKDACLRDAIILQRLGANVIRVYNLAPDINHDECASIFNAAGIYMLLDVNSGLYGTYMDRSKPWTTYTTDYLTHIFGVIEAFAPYPNTLGFFAGNEIINEDSDGKAPAYIRAVVRDMKEYIANNIARSVGVGYSAADVATMLTDTWNYLGCELENSTNSKIDFFGLNDYEWCGDSSFTDSGYDKLVEMFEGTNIPVFFSEYGCNNIEPRTFTNVPVMYGPQMTVLSGGLVYEYSEEAENYGLVGINSTDEVTLLPDYVNLEKQFAKIDTASLTKVNKTAEAQAASQCKPALITESAFINNWDLPERPKGGDDLVSKGISSKNPGSLVSVTATTMPATVHSPSSEATGLSLVILEDTDSNLPGLYKNYKSNGKSQPQPSYSPADKSGSGSSNSSSSDSDSDSSSSGSGSNSTSSGGQQSGASSMASVSTGALSIAVFVVSLFFL
ncbi:hypothetical protein AAFC00_003919 [Neodothiora populina]|uniref:1,3-beta-glucanosyltransferase n=1 Tax=Neodothiora populina TaxID=2781224 RepID=A0ABR3PFW8_9PEZI